MRVIVKVEPNVDQVKTMQGLEYNSQCQELILYGQPQWVATEDLTESHLCFRTKLLATQ